MASYVFSRIRTSPKTISTHIQHLIVMNKIVKSNLKKVKPRPSLYCKLQEQV